MLLGSRSPNRAPSSTSELPTKVATIGVVMVGGGGAVPQVDTSITPATSRTVTTAPPASEVMNRLKQRERTEVHTRACRAATPSNGFPRCGLVLTAQGGVAAMRDPTRARQALR